MPRKKYPAKKPKLTTDPAALTRAERDKRIWELRKQKLGITEIAAAVGLSKARVHAIIVREQGILQQDTQEIAHDYRAEQLELLAEVKQAVRGKVLAEADSSDVQALVGLLKHEADLTGAKSAAKTEISGSLDVNATVTSAPTDAAVRAAMEQLSEEEALVVAKFFSLVHNAQASEDEDDD